MRPSGAYRADIDGLRALAVLAVIANHMAAEIAPGGYLGVDVFFVISGFVITSSLMRDRSAGFGAFILSFYQRRIRRLLPALIVFAVVMALLLALIDEFALIPLKTGAAALLGLSNVYLAFRGVDYFSETAEENGFLHTWSLGVEEQFYLLFPLLFWLCRRRAQGHRLFVALIALGCAVSLGLFLALYQSHSAYAYYLAPFRAWELGAGVLACALCQSGAAPARALRRTPPMLPLATLLAVLLAPPSEAGLSALAAVLASALLIIALHGDDERRSGWVLALATSRPAVFIGLISYSLYLWHWGVLTIGRLTFGVTPETAPILLAAMFALATASYYVVERPFRAARPRQMRQTRRATVGIGLGASFASAVFVASLIPALPHSNLAALSGHRTEHVTLTWWRDQLTGAYLETCHLKRDYDPSMLAPCLSPIGDAAATFLIGDSHARNYAPTLGAAFPDRELRYLTMGYGCGFLPDRLARERDGVGCGAYNREVTAHLLAGVGPGDIVAIGQRLLDQPERWDGSYFDHLEASVAALVERGAQVILLDGVYPPGAHPRRCLDLPWRPARGDCAVSEAKTEAAFAVFDRSAARIADRIDGLWYAPLRSKLCIDGVCGQRTKTGAPIWHDADHLTEDAARELAPDLLRALRRKGFADDAAPRAQGS